MNIESLLNDIGMGIVEISLWDVWFNLVVNVFFYVLNLIFGLNDQIE